MAWLRPHFVWLLLLPLGTTSAPDAAHATPQPLAPHRAVYEMRLDDAKTGSGIAALSGRMVFEFRGTSCEGFTQSIRLVTRIVGRDGNQTLSDMRTSSWEDAAGDKFSFSSTTLRNQKVAERVAGNAERADDGTLKVDLSRPSDATLNLRTRAMFPVDHTQALIARSRAGERVFQADVYDGSESGEKYYTTTSIIGKGIAAGKDAAIGDAPPNAAFGLGSLKSWPVAISYFEPSDATGEGLPTYEMGFRLFENGVARNLRIDYGGFSVKGNLSDVTYFPPQTCD
ncbi:MAG: cell envelope integrity EipB family protein [Pseudomonadota bacterium]